MKRILSIMLAVLLVLTSFSGSFADVVNNISGSNNIIIFNDVPSNHWASREIQYFAGQKIVNGSGNGNFAPDEGVTREQFAKMLVLTFNAEVKVPTTPTFSDLNPNDWSYGYVETCKLFLTGYNNPFGGKPSFRPLEFATREDIAVALVQMMGFTAKDVKNQYTAISRFSDADTITESLLPYVNVAVEKGLISGYPDGTFGANRGISRAETVVLLNRAMKQAVTDIQAEVLLNANLRNTDQPATVYIDIESLRGASVTVNGEAVTMRDDDKGNARGKYTYTFTAEGEKAFVVTAAKNGKTKVVTLVGKYLASVPVLKISDMPAVSNKKEVTFKGTMFDAKELVRLTVNGNYVDETWNINKQDNWSKTVQLKEGENTFEFLLINKSGKVAREVKTLIYQIGLPTLTITDMPTESTAKQITVRGTMYDPQHTLTLTVNGTNVASTWWQSDTKAWSTQLNLKEGENKFEFVLTNAIGKIVKDVRTVVYKPVMPEIVFLNCPEQTQEANIDLQGRIANYVEGMKLYINDKETNLSWTGKEFSYPVKLVNGDNHFVFRAVNKLGQATIVNKVVKLVPLQDPSLVLGTQADKVAEAAYTVSGTVTDPWDSAVAVTVNGAPVEVKAGKFTSAITLIEGPNTVVVVAKNKFNRVSTQSFVVTYTKPILNPVLAVDALLENVTSSALVVSGAASDPVDPAVVVTVNGAPVEVKDGKFSTTVTLVEGANTITVVAKNKFDKTVTVTRVVTYTKPVTP